MDQVKKIRNRHIPSSHPGKIGRAGTKALPKSFVPGGRQLLMLTWIQRLQNDGLIRHRPPGENSMLELDGVSHVYGKVPRYTKIRVKALDIDGNEVRLRAEGFLARVIQHEVDHTNGIVFIDHIRDNSEAFYTLDEKGELQPLNYDEHIKDSRILWD